MTAMSDSSFLGTGWSFPPAFDNADHELRLTSGVDNLNRSIDLLMNTPKGSRSLMPGYGSDVANYLFRRIDASACAQISQSVQTTLLDYEPRIDVLAVDVVVSDDGATVELRIAYSIRQTNARHNHVIPFSVHEGTNLPGSR
jgi:phage baseplate assembly protein W